MKALASILFAIAIASAGWFSWTKYQGNQESSVASNATRAAALQMERQLNARKEDGITFVEYFKRGSSVIEKLDEEVAELQTKPWSYRQKDRDLAIEFIDQCKAVVRADQAEMRLLLEQSTATDALDVAKKDVDEATSSVAIEFSSKRRARASEDLIKVLDKLIENAKQNKPKIEKMIATDDAVKSRFGKDAGLSEATSLKLKHYIASEEATPPKEG